MKEDARLTDSFSHPSRWWWSHPSLCPSFFLTVSPSSSSSSRPPLLLFLFTSTLVLACQPFILYQDESVRVGPNIKGDGSPLARDRDTEIRRSDGSELPYWRAERRVEWRGSWRRKRFRALQSFLSRIVIYVDGVESLLDQWLWIKSKASNWIRYNNLLVNFKYFFCLWSMDQRRWLNKIKIIEWLREFKKAVENVQLCSDAI